MLSSLLLSLLSTLPAAVGAADGDARLNQICFLDAKQGWAVGDRGVILHTDDGGQRWLTQNSGVDCTLSSVCFANDQLGWAAGGRTQPYTHLSSGVVLSTRDGGKTWSHDDKLILPCLRQIGFFDPRHGWAAGCRSGMYPSGTFTSDDAGRTWRPVVGDTPTGWTAAAFAGPRNGLLAGRNGATGLILGGQLESIRSADLELRSLAAASLLSPTRGWLVGEGGWVRRLVERPPDGAAPAEPSATPLAGTALTLVPAGGAHFVKAVRHFDLAAVAARGTCCWVAGNPGTRIFHTPDAGRTWQDFATGSTVPLRSITFVDDQHGWAAGELGTILATDDGGRTWRHQHGDGARAAVLGVFADPEDVPFELIARLAGSDGYRTVIDVLGRRDIEVTPRGDVPLPDRLHEAVVRAGGSAADVAWQFPLRQAGLHVERQAIIDAWDRVNDGHGLDDLRARIVRTIRTWRPTVLVIGDAHNAHDDPLAALIQEATLKAVAEAADSNAFADQIVEAGLSAWRVARVAVATPPGERGAIELVTAQFMPVLGRSLDDAAAEPRGLLRDQFEPSPRILGFQTLVGAAAASPPRDFFAGLSITPASESRRALTAPPLDRLDVLQRMTRKRRQAQAVIAMAERRGGSAEQLLAQIDELTRDLDPSGAGQLIYQLADHYYRTGRWSIAAETFEALVQRYPQHPLAPLALRWLLQFHASSEAALRAGVDSSRQAKWRERAVACGQQIERTQLEWFAQPGVRFPLAAAYRGLGQDRQADRLWMAQCRSGGRDAWWACGQAELPRAEGKNRPFKPLLPCLKTDAKPHLDGRLDEPFWQKAKPAVLRSAQGDDDGWPAQVMLAYDAEFLYVAISCRRAARTSVGDDGSPGPRSRDADLSGHDRVELFLDVDRDYSTFYHLAIDDRGWTFDRCWADATWNPTWFVASSRAKDRWTAEAAIPLKELVGRAPQPSDSWAIGIQRIVPRAGFQSWNTPAAIAVLPDGFGWLAFQ